MQKISYLQVKPGMKLAKPIWHPYSYKILLNAGTIITGIYVKRLTELQIKEIYISRENSLRGEDFPEIPAINNFPDCIEKQVYLETYLMFSNIFNDIKVGKALSIPPVAKTVESLVEQILLSKEIMCQMALIKAHDNYTVTHSINVAIFSVFLGSFLSWTKEDLIQIGIGALLHDIGKARIPTMILNKPGSLDYHEFAVIKQHPLLGFEELKDIPEISEMAISVVRDHHERCDGSGYPRGSLSKDISQAAKIAAIADVYDALTTDRAYREALMPHQVLEFLMVNGSMGHLDPKLIKLFLHYVAVYPVGALVELTTGQIGKVVDFPPQMPMRPTVQIKSQINQSEVIALVKHPTIFIKKILNY